MTPEETFLKNIETIEAICRSVCRKSHVRPDEVADFTQEVKVRLIEDDYAIMRKFKGRSSFSTYLTTVITRLYYEYRNKLWGKWRPSAEAKRIGEKAITLERLISRDGLTFAEAVQVLTTRKGSPYTVAELEAIYKRLPPRTPRPKFVSDDDTPEAAGESDASDRVRESEQERTERVTNEIVQQAMETLSDEDRLILRMWFWEGRTAPEIASRLHMEQKKVYKQLKKLCAILREALERAGIRREDFDF